MNTKLYNVGCDAKNASISVVSQENVNSSDMSFKKMIGELIGLASIILVLIYGLPFLHILIN